MIALIYIYLICTLIFVQSTEFLTVCDFMVSFLYLFFFFSDYLYWQKNSFELGLSTSVSSRAEVVSGPEESGDLFSGPEDEPSPVRS